jgi:hypothetical protein
MVFSKSSGEIFKLKKISHCPPDTIGRRLFINDIDGIGNPMYLSSENELFITTHEIIDLVNSSKEDDNPILQIFHLK